MNLDLWPREWAMYKATILQIIRTHMVRHCLIDKTTQRHTTQGPTRPHTMQSNTIICHKKNDLPLYQLWLLTYRTFFVPLHIFCSLAHVLYIMFTKQILCSLPQFLKYYFINHGFGNPFIDVFQCLFFSISSTFVYVYPVAMQFTHFSF